MLSNKTAYTFLIITSILWGTNAVIGKILASHIEPMAMVFVRWIPACILFLPLSYKYLKKHKAELLENWYLFFFQGVAGMVLFPYFLYWGLQTSTALNASLIVSISPAIIVISNHFLGIEKICLRNVFYCCLSVIGVALLLTKGNMEILLSLKFTSGDLLMVLAAVIWSYYMVLSKYNPKHIHPFAIVQSQMIVVAILSPILMFAIEGTIILSIEWTATVISGVVFMIFGSSLLCYYLFIRGTAVTGSLVSALFLNLIPISAALFSITLLGEKLHTYHFISGTIIAFSIYKLAKQKPLILPK